MSPKGTKRVRTRRGVSSLTVEQLAEDWFRSQRARDLSSETLRLRRHNIRTLTRFLERQGLSTRIAEITKADLEEFLIAAKRGHSEHTLMSHFNTLRVFFNWLVGEEELIHSPIARIPKPELHEQPPDVLTADEIQRLLRTCGGKSFADRRDRAILLLLIDTGMRRQDVVQLTLDTIDREAQTVSIVSKGRRARKPHYDKVAAAALDAYLRARLRYVTEHPRLASEHGLWLGLRGRLTATGVYQIVRRRAKQAGLDGVHPHLFRHGFAHDWLAAGGQEGDLATLAGWTPGSPMLRRYGAALRQDRAIEAHKRFSPANRLAGRETTKGR